MYSPKIREDLIPRIYRVAKTSGTAMTKWVNQALELALSQAGEAVGQEANGNEPRKEARKS